MEEGASVVGAWVMVLVVAVEVKVKEAEQAVVELAVVFEVGEEVQQAVEYLVGVVGVAWVQEAWVAGVWVVVVVGYAQGWGEVMEMAVGAWAVWVVRGWVVVAVTVMVVVVMVVGSVVVGSLVG